MPNGLFNLKQQIQAVSQAGWPNARPIVLDYLVVAGGGGAYVGGAGAGGLLQGSLTVNPTSSLTVTVGAGGGMNTQGSNSVFGSVVAIGGGTSSNGGSGGSGGGGNHTSGTILTGGQGVPGQGFPGGTNNSGTTYSGGGGGAGSKGFDAYGNGGGNGGIGAMSDISGIRTVYAGGGGGSGTGTQGIGGLGGGGNANSNSTGGPNSGGQNTGGGAGGTYAVNGGNGGSGIVIVRYPGTTQLYTGGVLSYANGYVIHTFYSSGTLAPTAATTYANTNYQVSRSVRFNGTSSTFSRTPASASNQKTWTYSVWTKRAIGLSDQKFLAVGSGGLQTNMSWNADSLIIYDNGFSVQTNTVYRDYSAWYHVLFVCDTTQPVASDRMKIYVNGVLLTSFTGGSTYPTINYNTLVNSTTLHEIGSQVGTRYQAGYLAEMYLIDGLALNPHSFGFTNPTTGVWQPIKYTGSYGTNGFYLNFSDNSAATAITLGKDSSGNGNNYTPSNLSVTNGVNNCSMVDTPTPYGTDTGTGGEVRGNYATWDPLILNGIGVACTFSDSNLTVTNANAAGGNAASSFVVRTGKWYYEAQANGINGPSHLIGIYNAFNSLSGVQNYGSIRSGNSGWYNLSATPFSGTTFTAEGSIIGVAWDCDAGKCWFSVNGTWVNSGNPSAGTGEAFTFTPGTEVRPFLAFDNQTGTKIWYANFGQRPFSYTAPSGFKSLCTTNLPTPTIGATSTTLANQYFDTSLYTGTGAVQTVTNSGYFQPNFVWGKSRSAALINVLFNSVVGASKGLSSNNTNAEFNIDTSFANAGFSMTSDINSVGQTYVAWQWKGGSASGVTNTSGSITSTVSANTTSGFSIVTFTGNGLAGATVGHGLGVAPSMVIVKSRGNARNWLVYHASIGATQFLQLDTTIAATASASAWNDTAPTSSVFFLGTSLAGNESGVTRVAYCFAQVPGYSRFGSFVGNGSADGPYAYCGFRPAFYMVKNVTTAGGNWLIYDSKRSTSNLNGFKLSPNLSVQENENASIGDTSIGVDFLSNGVKVRTTGPNNNNSGDTYIFAAFAESPFKYAIAR